MIGQQSKWQVRDVLQTDEGRLTITSVHFSNGDVVYGFKLEDSRVSGYLPESTLIEAGAKKVSDVKWFWILLSAAVVLIVIPRGRRRVQVK